MSSTLSWRPVQNEHSRRHHLTRELTGDSLGLQDNAGHAHNHLNAPLDDVVLLRGIWSCQVALHFTQVPRVTW
jgi:hypothetical protein